MFNDRLDRIGEYPFDRLRALLDLTTPETDKQHLSLALGEPKHAVPNIVHKILEENRELWGRYPPVWGTKEFRSAIGQWLIKRYGVPNNMIDQDKCILPVSGTREALFMIALTIVPERISGKQPLVLMPNPFYQVYLGATVSAGAEPFFLPAIEETKFLPNFKILKPDTLDRTALAYYCSPSNPQGTVASLDALTAIVHLARKHNFVIVFDECYSEIYNSTPPPGGISACEALGGSLENVLIMNSLSKRSSVPGLRSGFVAGDPNIIARFKRLRDYGGAPPPIPLLAVSAALWQNEDHVKKNRELYRKKFDLADQMLSGIGCYYRPEGGFYLWLNVGNSEAVALKLWKKAGLRVMPGTYLSKNTPNENNPGMAYIRCALVHDLETTSQSLERLAKTL